MTTQASVWVRAVDPGRERRMIECMRKVADSPPIAIVAAGATLAPPKQARNFTRPASGCAP
jgi:hypothetical protein